MYLQECINPGIAMLCVEMCANEIYTSDDFFVVRVEHVNLGE